MLRPVKLRYYVDAMQARGFAPRQVLRGSGMDMRQLSSPDALVNLHQCQVVVANMIRLTGDQAVGFDMGSRMQLADFGIIAHAMISARTLRQAINYWLQYSNLVGMLIRLTLLEQANRSWSVVFTATEPMGFIYNFCVEEILVAGVKLGTALSGEPLRVKELRLSYPAPLHADLYAQHFQCPVHFNAERSSITVLSPRIDAPMPGNDDELNAVYRRHCSRMLRQVSGPDPVTARVRGMLLRRSAAIPGLEEAAVELGMSDRSLRRHLQQEGTSYQQLVNRFRYDLAGEYLSGDHLSPKEVGYLLGFSDTNAFRRAFRSWSGQTISAFRAGDRPRTPSRAGKS
jgi:AraC-like DNA-binding protein